MAQDTPSLKESPLDLALANAEHTYDPEAGDTPDQQDDGEGRMGGHPAQEEDVEADADEGGPRPLEPVTPPPPPVAPTTTPVSTEPSAETRRVEAEQRMNLAIQETNVLKAERDRLQREADDLRRQATPPTETVPPRDLPDVKAARAQLRQKLQEISAVDTKLADYWERLEEGYVGMIDPLIQARATEVFQNLSPGQQAAMRQALLKDPEFLDAMKTALAPGVQSQVAADQENTRVFAFVVDEAKKAGFDVSGQGEEADLFWNVAVAYADKTMPQGTTEARTAQALDTMRRLKGIDTPQVTPTPPVPPAAPARPVRQPMGRQSAGPPSTGGTEGTLEKPISLDDAINQTHGRSRV